MDQLEPTIEHGELEEDVVPYLTTSRPRLGVKARPMALEVHQVWGNTLLETRQFPVATAQPVRIGAEAARRWRFLGVDMGWVNPVGAVLPFLAPGWSEVEIERRTEFFVPRAALPDDADHVLFAPEDDGYVAIVPDSWTVVATIDEIPHDAARLVASGRATPTADGLRVPVTPDLTLRVEGAGLVWFAGLTETAPRFNPRMGGEPDHAFLASLGFGAFLFGVSQLALWFAPLQETQGAELEDRFVTLAAQAPPEAAKKKDVNGPEAASGAKAKKPEGTAGKRDAKVDRTKGPRREIQRHQLDREIAENAGVLAKMTDMDAMFGRSGLAAGLEAGVGGLIGSRGDAFGHGGLHGRGDGLGGGGTVDGIGGFGPRGPGTGDAGDGGDLGVKQDGGLPTGGTPTILGALDRALIDAVIKDHMSQIRYCYQRELTKDPDLAGKVVMKFVIASDGTVSSASPKSSTLRQAAVDTCLTGKFLRMQFPAPQGGGIVIVSYPFLFSPA